MINRFLRIDPLFFLSSTILFCILRMVVPNINYLFIPLLFLFVVYSSYHFLKRNSIELLALLIKYNLLLILVGLLILLGNIISSDIILFAVKEFLNALVVIFIGFTCFMFINARESFDRFVLVFSTQLIYFSVAVSIIGLIKYILQLNGIYLPASLSSDQVGTSLNSDYNFNVLFSFLGIFSIMYNYSKYRKARYFLFLTVLFMNIVFSGSRRGMFFLLLIFIFLLLFGTGFRFEIRKVLKRLAILFIMASVAFLGIVIFKKQNSIITRNQSIDLLKTTQAQNIITRISYRYFTMINSEKSIYGFYLDLWAKANPTDNVNMKKQYPKSSDNNLMYNGNFDQGLKYWYPMAGKTQHDIVETPYGKGVRVTRFEGDNSGWTLQYSARDNISYAGHTYVISFQYKLVKGEGIPFKIGIKLDDQFLGTSKTSNLYPIISDLESGWKDGSCSYSIWKSCSGVPLFMNSQQNNTVVEFADIKLKDLDTVDSLPTFSDQVSFSKNEILSYLKRYDSTYYARDRFSVNNTNLFYNGDFKSGTRYWLPAASATEHSIIETPYGKGIKVVRKDGTGTYWSLMYNGRPIIYHADHTYKLSFLFKVVKGSGIPFYVGWQAEDGYRGFPSYSLPYKINYLKNGWQEVICMEKFGHTHYDLPTFLNSMKNNTEVEIANVRLEDMDSKDSLPKFVDELYTKKIDVPNLSNKNVSFTDLQSDFYSSRIVRWEYATKIFRDSLTLTQKIFGGGFDYVASFGEKFSGGENDYPHNPFLSAFLYSGIIGGFLYIWYIILVIYYYLKNYKRHKFFFFCFMIVFSFSFVSGNTHFSVPAFAILAIIPFLTKYIVDTETQQRNFTN